MNIRLSVKEWSPGLLCGYAAGDSSREVLRVRIGREWGLEKQLYAGATVNLLECERDESGALCPALFILEPDYLIDITAVCQCVRPSCTTPLHYLLSKFMPREDTPAIQLGNAANQFLDDILNQELSFRDSMQKSFREYPLKYCTMEGVDKPFFEDCLAQHEHIREAVSRLFPTAGMNPENTAAQLEPSFICPPLGLQGRMDMLTTDLRNIVELKSGKCEEYHHTFKEEHALQMALYKEVLHYCTGQPYEQISTFLLYSRYPELYDIRIGRKSIVSALAVRNGIVHIDRMLRQDAKAFLKTLTEQDFNPFGRQDKLYMNYIRPRILRFLETIGKAEPTALDYFCTMTSFLQREQFFAKVGDRQSPSDRSFARAWLCDTEKKRTDGDIITHLRLEPVYNEKNQPTHLRAIVREGDYTESNFREGDSILLYECNSDGDSIVNRQTMRCYIEAICPDSFLLRVAHPQRYLPPLTSLYAIEPSHSDSLFSTQYRGLYALLSAPRRRRDLILGQSTPTAEDFFLLIGPPGSGKTNIALRRMVEDVRTRFPEENILLMAYTNRAVDEICQMLEGASGHEAYVRIGAEYSCGAEYRSRLMSNYISTCRNRSEILERLRPVRIICGTVSSLCGTPELFRLKRFHTAYLDEASQVLEPQLLPLWCARGADGSPAIGRFVFIGDHKQLPAVVCQPPEDSLVQSPLLRHIGLHDCRESLFERFYRGRFDGTFEMLTRQGRMHETISRWVSQTYYEGRLTPVPLPHQTEELPWHRYDVENRLQTYIATRRMGALDVTADGDESNPKTNDTEARRVAEMVQSLYSLHTANGIPWQPGKEIGIIVPFRGQIATIRQYLQQFSVPQAEDITIDTVERYQGSQRETILFSTVVRQPGLLQILSSPVETDGRLIDRKLNVAVSRARRQFFIVGSLNLLRQSPDYRDLLRYIAQTL